MKLIKQLSAGLLLTFGMILLMAAVYAPFNNEGNREDNISEGIACLLFGLPVTATGGWLAWGLLQQGKKEKRDRLNSIFYQLIQEGNGEITVLRFAMNAQISGAEAKKFLDEKAQEFGSDFEVSEDGGIYYRFFV